MLNVQNKNEKCLMDHGQLDAEAEKRLQMIGAI